MNQNLSEQIRHDVFQILDKNLHESTYIDISCINKICPFPAIEADFFDSVFPSYTLVAVFLDDNNNKITKIDLLTIPRKEIEDLMLSYEGIFAKMLDFRSYTKSYEWLSDEVAIDNNNIYIMRYKLEMMGTHQVIEV